MVRFVGLNRNRSRINNSHSVDSNIPVITATATTAVSVSASVRNNSGSNNNNSRRKRLAPAARSPEDQAQLFPMYQYAIEEFAHTVPAGTSNDAGKLMVSEKSFISTSSTTHTAANSPDITISYSNGATIAATAVKEPTWEQRKIRDAAGLSHEHVSHSIYISPMYTTNNKDGDGYIPPIPTEMIANFFQDQELESDCGSSQQAARRPTPYPSYYRHDSYYGDNDVHPTDASYEESYGEAYTGGPIKYLYPSGYQGMRPRSCPWKISILVCLLFTWLSVFIVGHCSDQVSEELDQYNQDDLIDDRIVILQIRWCGSRPLYLMWVTSMLITGLSAAYCSIIGYIQIRDLAVGNMRSQPPGVVRSGKSDYYIRIDKDHYYNRTATAAATTSTTPGTATVDNDDEVAGDSTSPVYPHLPAALQPTTSATGSSSSSASNYYYRPSIYQSDGTPQFWGAHIYRPTQAAVAVTSR